MQQWDYFVFYAYVEQRRYVVPLDNNPTELEQFLERCGAGGWELVNILPIGFHPTGDSQLMPSLVETSNIMGVLKRPKR